MVVAWWLLEGVWWLTGSCQMVAWRLPGACLGCLVVAWWLPGGCLVVAWWLPGGCLVVAWFLPGGYWRLTCGCLVVV